MSSAFSRSHSSRHGRGAITWLFLGFCLAAGLRASAQSFQFKVDAVSSYVIVAGANWIVNNAVYNHSQLYFTNILLKPLALNGVAYPSTAPDIMSFCAQIDQDVSLNTTYTFNFAPMNQAGGGLTAAQVRNIQILFDLYYKGDNPAGWTNDTAAAFQACLWEIETDSGMSLSTGSFRNNGATGTFITLGQTMLNAIAATGTSYVPVINTVAIIEPTYQDLMFTQSIEVTLIPFGVHAWPGACLLGALAFIRIRRRMRIAVPEPV